MYFTPRGERSLKKYITHSEDETRRLGEETAARLSGGAVVALSGDLGCGKTAFVKGFAEYFGCDDEVSSPTYTLVNEYDAEIPIYHFDVYRLNHPSVDECDWLDEYLFGDGICLIERADNISEVLPEDTVWIRFKKLPEDGGNDREITVE